MRTRLSKPVRVWNSDPLRLSQIQRVLFWHDPRSGLSPRAEYQRIAAFLQIKPGVIPNIPILQCPNAEYARARLFSGASVLAVPARTESQPFAVEEEQEWGRWLASDQIYLRDRISLLMRMGDHPPLNPASRGHFSRLFAQALDTSEISDGDQESVDLYYGLHHLLITHPKHLFFGQAIAQSLSAHLLHAEHKIALLQLLRRQGFSEDLLRLAARGIRGSFQILNMQGEGERIFNLIQELIQPGSSDAEVYLAAFALRYLQVHTDLYSHFTPIINALSNRADPELFYRLGRSAAKAAQEHHLRGLSRIDFLSPTAQAAFRLGWWGSLQKSRRLEESATASFVHALSQNSHHRSTAISVAPSSSTPYIPSSDVVLEHHQRELVELLYEFIPIRQREGIQIDQVRQTAFCARVIDCFRQLMSQNSETARYELTCKALNQIHHPEPAGDGFTAASPFSAIVQRLARLDLYEDEERLAPLLLSAPEVPLRDLGLNLVLRMISRAPLGNGSNPLAQRLQVLFAEMNLKAQAIAASDPIDAYGTLVQKLHHHFQQRIAVRGSSPPRRWIFL